jgi:hypothetical protein
MDITTGNFSLVLSDSIYDKYDYEMEGLDFWDLSAKGLGTMHMFGNFMQVHEKGIDSYDP